MRSIRYHPTACLTSRLRPRSYSSSMAISTHREPTIISVGFFAVKSACGCMIVRLTPFFRLGYEFRDFVRSFYVIRMFLQREPSPVATVRSACWTLVPSLDLAPAGLAARAAPLRHPAGLRCVPGTEPTARDVTERGRSQLAAGAARRAAAAAETGAIFWTPGPRGVRGHDPSAGGGGCCLPARGYRA